MTLPAYRTTAITKAIGKGRRVLNCLFMACLQIKSRQYKPAEVPVFIASRSLVEENGSFPSNILRNLTAVKTAGCRDVARTNDFRQ